MIKLFLPENSELTLLEELKGTITVCQHNLVAGRNKPGTVLLKNGQGSILNLTIDYDDVVFKFECFSLRVSKCYGEDGEVEIFTWKEWDKIKCCFRFEWEYPEYSSTSSSTNSEILRNDGKLQNIPPNIINAGATMTGIIFWNSFTNLPVSALVHDIYDTTDITLLTSIEEIDAYMKSVDVVNLEDSKEWCQRVTSVMQERS